MAPTLHSGRRSNYKKTQSTHTGPLLSLPYKVQKTPTTPKFECVLCSRLFRSKGAVKTHFRRHPSIPFNQSTNQHLPAYTHPSCWPATEGFTWEKQDAVLQMKKRIAATNRNRFAVEDAMEEVGALTAAEHAVKQELKKLSRWWWWWTVQGDDIKEALENAPPGDLNIVGSADKALPGPTTFPASADVQQRAPNSYPATIANNLQDIAFQDPGTSSHTPTRSDCDDYFPRDRGPGAGRLWIDIDLSGHKGLSLRNVQQFISTCNIHYLTIRGENFNAHTALSQAALAFVESLTPDSRFRSTLQRWLQTREGPEYHMLVDRMKLWDLVAKSTREFLAGRDDIPRRSQDEQALATAMEMYAKSLDNPAAMDRITTYRDGANDDALDVGYDLQFGPQQR